MSKIRVLIVDDHTLFRKGLINILDQCEDIDIVGEAKNGEEGILKAMELKPDIILMDIKMPAVDGISATKKIREESPDAKIIILTVSDADRDLFAAIQAGAKGYMLKDSEPEHLIKSILLLAEGKSVISHDMTNKLMHGFNELSKKTLFIEKGKDESNLSSREMEILKFLAEGKSNKEIGMTLSISEHTVKIHVRHILKKLNLNNRTQAALYTVKEGIK